jgi:hypothetical protein
MSDTSKLGFPEAARRLGVPVRILRRAIRTGKIPAPPHLTAIATLPAEWFASAQAAVEASPNVLSRAVPQKVPAFARYNGTSAWHAHRNRVRNYAHVRAAAKRMGQTQGTPGL